MHIVFSVFLGPEFNAKGSCKHVYIRAYRSLWAGTKYLILLFMYKVLSVFIYSQGTNSVLRNRECVCVCVYIYNRNYTKILETVQKILENIHYCLVVFLPFVHVLLYFKLSFVNCCLVVFCVLL